MNMPRNRIHEIAFALWRIKGTLLVLAVIITIGVLTDSETTQAHGRLLDRFGFDFDDLSNARFWHFLTSTWLQSTPGIAWTMIVVVFGGAFFLELFAGTSAMLITCITGDWVATLLTSMTLRVLTEFGDSSVANLLSTPDSGTSAFAHAGIGAAVLLLPRRWLKVAIPILIVLVATQFYYIELTPAIVHSWAALYGALVSWFVWRPRVRPDSRIWPWKRSPGYIATQTSDT